MDQHFNYPTLCRELRIGNLVLEKHYTSDQQLNKYSFVAVDARDIFHIQERWKENVSPIKLRPDLLIRLDFQLQQGIYKLSMPELGKKYWALYYDDKEQIIKLEYASGFYDLFERGHIKYVHQLQNVYQPLTGQELDVSSLLQGDLANISPE